MTSEYRHIPVLLTECIDALDLPDHPVFVDATLGFAGHSFEAAKQLGAGGLLIGIDQDEVALTEAAAKLESIPAGDRPELALLRDVVDRKKSGIMPRPRIFLAGISEPRDYI